MISSATAQEIRFRISNGEKIRTIAQSLGISRNTVRSYMRDADKGFQKVEAGSIGGRHKLAIGNDASLANLYLQARGNSAVIRRRVQATPEAYGLHNLNISPKIDLGRRLICDRQVSLNFQAAYVDQIMI